MPDAIFAHRRLAASYDAFDGHRDDLDLYLGLVGELSASVVLDVGCGTGSLAVRLAAGGRTVVAVDPAEASLEVARLKNGAAEVRWIHGDAAALPPLGADLAVMTGNVAQVFLNDEDWEQALSRIPGLAGMGGRYRSGHPGCCRRRSSGGRPEVSAWLSGEGAPATRSLSRFHRSVRR